jgi:outer membrane protein TolC
LIRSRLTSCLLASILGTAPFAPAQGASARAVLPDPALDALVAEALAASPEIASATAQAQAVRERIEPSRTPPDPFVAVEYQNDGWEISLGEEEMTYLGLMYSQPLPWPGKLKLSGLEAERRADQVQAERVGRTLLTIESRLRRAWWDVALAESLLELLEGRRGSWREIAGIARERYETGLAVQQDVLRAQIELLRLDETRAELNALAAARLAEINRLLRRPADQPLERAGTLALREVLPPLEGLIAAVRDRSPELAGIRLGIEAEKARVERADKERSPDFVVSLGPMSRGNLEPMWQAGVGLTLPIFSGSRQGPLLAAARAELRASESLAESLALELELRTRERWQALRASLEVARLYGGTILPMDELSLESAMASYRTGKVPFLTVFEAMNVLYADREAYLSRLAEAERRRVAIDEADPAGEPMTAAGGRRAPMALGVGGAARPGSGPSNSGASDSMGMR